MFRWLQVVDEATSNYATICHSSISRLGWWFVLYNSAAGFGLCTSCTYMQDSRGSR